MRRVLASLLIVAALASANAQSPARRSEAARIAIKRASDPAAASLVNQTPKKTTVEDLLRMSRPDGLAADTANPEAQTKRYSPLETTLWEIEVTIKEIVLRADGDFYMVVEGASGARTVVEVPDPRLCPNSKLIKKIQAVRNQLAKKFHPTGQSQKVDLKAVIVGAGYFGFQGRNPQGGQTNGARLMPGVGVTFVEP